MWLAGRIATAERARDLLEQKRAVLIGAEREAARRSAEATTEWHARATTAERWLERTAVLDGERPQRIARAHAGAPAEMHVRFGMTMGVGVPADPSVELAPAPDVALLPGGASLIAAITSHRDAVEAALRAAVAATAHARLAAELSSTVRRVRAIESRWLPLHERALAALEQELDENDRSEGARIRWAARREVRAGTTDGTETP
jgi:vacuolar-type H+-ATPase subunit D/Vma8